MLARVSPVTKLRVTSLEDVTRIDKVVQFSPVQWAVWFFPCYKLNGKHFYSKWAKGGMRTPPFAHNRGQKQQKANIFFPYLEYAYSNF